MLYLLGVYSLFLIKNPNAAWYVVAIIVVIGIIILLLVNKRMITSVTIEPKHSLLGYKKSTGEYELNNLDEEHIMPYVIEKMFREFKESKIYASTVLYMINPLYEEKLDLKELNNYLYGHFMGFRQYMHSIAPKLIGTDIDYCILTIAGFRQKDMYKLMNNISQSGVRNIKSRLKEKLPSQVYHYIVEVNHAAY